MRNVAARSNSNCLAWRYKSSMSPATQRPLDVRKGPPVKGATRLRPWQFSLRFLLGVTALVAVGAAFFGWRARQLEPQRRAVARIVELGGSVEMERRGCIEAIRRGRDTE